MPEAYSTPSSQQKLLLEHMHFGGEQHVRRAKTKDATFRIKPSQQCVVEFRALPAIMRMKY